MRTAGHGEIVDLTEGVRSVVRGTGVSEGLVTVFATGSTVAVTTMEHEPGVLSDLGELLERLVPTAGEYAHDALNGDSNAHAHLRAAMIGPSVSIPLAAGALALGAYQQVVLLDFDDRLRTRTVAVQVIA
jgi:secondary thiamine-phosphate synthase enzyme